VAGDRLLQSLSPVEFFARLFEEMTMDDETKDVPASPGCAAVHAGEIGSYLDALTARIERLEKPGQQPEPADGDSSTDPSVDQGLGD
jgi:hypothetical protein